MSDTRDRIAADPPGPYVPHGEGVLRRVSGGHVALVYPDRLSEMPLGGVKTLLGNPFPPQFVLSLDPLTIKIVVDLSDLSDLPDQELAALADRHRAGTGSPGPGDPAAHARTA